MTTVKVCKTCNKTLSLSSFHKNQQIKDGYSNKCKKCKSLHNRGYYSKNREQILFDVEKYTSGLDPEKLKQYKASWYERNKEKCKQKAKQHYANNREAKKTYQKEYIAKNQDKIKQSRKKYRSNPEVKNRLAVWEREKCKNDLNYRLSRSLRSRINSAIKKGYKAGSAVSDLGCSINEFKEYISLQFEEGMTWDNWGRGKDKWHLDHKLPLSNFDLTDRDQFLRAVHYTNLQPLWSGHNLNKGNKVPKALTKTKKEITKSDFLQAIKEGLGYQALSHRFNIKYTEVKTYLNKWNLSLEVSDNFLVPKEELQSLYKTARMSRQKIADYFCVSKSLINKMLVDYQIPLNTGRGHLEDLLTKERLIEKLRDRKKVPQIAREFGTTECSVRRYLKEYGLSSKLHILYSTEELQRLADRGYSAREIGETLNLTRAQAKSLLRSKGISTSKRKTVKGDKVPEQFRKTLKCRECGTTDRDNFYSDCRQICKKCGYLKTKQKHN